MFCMFVTLDVSKLSGWLNADADCRVNKRAYKAAGSGREVEARWSNGDASDMQGEGPSTTGDRASGSRGTNCGLAHGTRTRTLSM